MIQLCSECTPYLGVTHCQPFLPRFQQNHGTSDKAIWLGKTVTELPIFTLGLNKRPGLIISFGDAI